MEQRPLRLGDIVDDYCPRERRVTNHAIVVIVEDAIRQTRCTTCDAEHAYKHAREPLRRRKDAPAVAPAIRAAAVAAAAIDVAGPAPPPVMNGEELVPEEAEAVVATEANISTAANGPIEPHQEDGWLSHRRLIRASLPRVEGEPPAPRPIPEFTMHQRPAGRGGGNFRFGRGSHGNGSGRGDAHQGRAPQQGDRNGNQLPGGGGGRHRGRGQGKRSR